MARESGESFDLLNANIERNMKYLQYKIITLTMCSSVRFLLPQYHSDFVHNRTFQKAKESIKYTKYRTSTCSHLMQNLTKLWKVGCRPFDESWRDKVLARSHFSAFVREKGKVTTAATTAIGAGRAAAEKNWLYIKAENFPFGKSFSTIHTIRTQADRHARPNNAKASADRDWNEFSFHSITSGIYVMGSLELKYISIRLKMSI